MPYGDNYHDYELEQIMPDTEETSEHRYEIEICPYCDGTGTEIVDWSGQAVVMGCPECRGTGEAVELIGEGLPHPLDG